MEISTFTRNYKVCKKEVNLLWQDVIGAVVFVVVVAVVVAVALEVGDEEE